MQRKELDKVRLESDLSSLSDSEDEAESDATEDEGDEAYELDAIKYARWMKTDMIMDDGRIKKKVPRWHYGVMWKNYLRALSDSGDQPTENFNAPEDSKEDLVVQFWRAIVDSGHAPPQLRLGRGQREPADPGKSLRHPYIFECPNGRMKAWLEETNGKRKFSTYLQRTRWEKEHPDEPIPKRLSDHYVYRKRLREKAKAEASGVNGKRFIKGGSIALKPKHLRKVREASSGDDEPERNGSASRSVGRELQIKKEKSEEISSRVWSREPSKEKKAKKDDRGSRSASTDLMGVKKVRKDGATSRSGSSVPSQDKKKRKAEDDLGSLKKAPPADKSLAEASESGVGIGIGQSTASSSSHRASPIIAPPPAAPLSAAPSEAIVPPVPRASSPTASESSLDSIFNSDHEDVPQNPKKRKTRIESSPIDEAIPAKVENKKTRIEATSSQPVSKRTTPLFTSSRSPSPVEVGVKAEPTAGPSFGEPEPGIFDATLTRAATKTLQAAPAAKRPAPVAQSDSTSAAGPQNPSSRPPLARPPLSGPSTSKAPPNRPPTHQKHASSSAITALPSRPSPTKPSVSRPATSQNNATHPYGAHSPLYNSVRPVPTGPSATANMPRPNPPQSSLYTQTMAHLSRPQVRPPIETGAIALQPPPTVASGSFVPRQTSYNPQQTQSHQQSWLQQPSPLPSPGSAMSPIVSPHLPLTAELYNPAFDPRLRTPTTGQASPLGFTNRSTPTEAYPNIFDRRFLVTIPLHSRPAVIELSLSSPSTAGDVPGAKLLSNLLFGNQEAREDARMVSGAFEQSETCCLQGQIALGAKLRFAAALQAFEPTGRPARQQVWDELGDRRGATKINASFTEQANAGEISAHYALVITRKETLGSHTGGQLAAGPSTGDLVFAVYEMPLDSRTPPMLPDPARPFAHLARPDNTPPTSPRPVDVVQSYGLAEDLPIPLKDRYVLIYPARDGPLDTLYGAIIAFCAAYGLRAAGDGRPAEVALLNAGKMDRTVRSTSIRQILARRVRFVSFGPSMDLYPNQWRATEVWQRGGLVTFSPTLLLRSPEKVEAIMRMIRFAETWSAYMVPEVLQWCDESWKQPAAFDTLSKSLPFDQQLERLSETDTTTTGGLIVSCCPPVIHDNAGCERWVTWLRKSSTSTTYPELVESCRGVSSTGFPSASGDKMAIQNMALIDVETAQLEDLARMRSRPHLLPYRRYIHIGEVSLDRKARDRYEAEIELVSAEDFAAVISGAV